MEDRVTYNVTADDGLDTQTEMVLTYVPEAEHLPFAVALSIARERDEEAADRLFNDLIQVADI